MTFTLYGMTLDRVIMQTHCDELLRISRINDEDTRRAQYDEWFSHVPAAVFDSLLDIPAHTLAGDAAWVADVCATWTDNYDL